MTCSLSYSYQWYILVFFMLVASFSGLYCSITQLHVYQCQPISLMNTQQLYFSLQVILYPDVDHFIELLARI